MLWFRSVQIKLNWIEFKYLNTIIYFYIWYFRLTSCVFCSCLFFLSLFLSLSFERRSDGQAAAYSSLHMNKQSYNDLKCIENKKILLCLSGVVPKPTGKVASAGEAGGELHQAPGDLLLSALPEPLPHRLLGLRPAAGPLALQPDHHLHLPAVPPGLHRWLAGPFGHLQPFSSSFYALFPAGLLPHLPSPGTRPSPAPHRLYVPPTPGVPVLCRSKELQYSLTEDEGEGTHSEYWEDVVMLRGAQKWTWRTRIHLSLETWLYPPAEGVAVLDIWKSDKCSLTSRIRHILIWPSAKVCH